MDDFVPRFARPEDRPALSRLWLACFPGDTMETVRAVFGRLALETECLVAAPDGFPVSMLLLLPQPASTPVASATVSNTLNTFFFITFSSSSIEKIYLLIHVSIDS